MTSVFAWKTSLVTACALALGGCAVGSLAPSARPTMAGTIAKAGTRPLLVDWGSSDRTLLNTSRTRGPLVVSVQDGAMEPLFECHVKGRYRYSAERSAQVQDEIIDNQDELHVKMPVFGARFAGDLARAGKLHVRMKVVGTFAADRATFERDDLDGNCASATHVATYVTVGAFRLFVLSTGELKGDVALAPGAEVNAATRASEQSLNEAGEESACAKATVGDVEPPEGCSTSLQLVLAPIAASDEPVAPVEQPRSVPALGVTAAGALIAGAATIAWIVNDGNYRELRDKCNSTVGCSSTRYDDSASSIHSWDRLSAGGWVLGGAMAIGGGIWWLSSGHSSTPYQPRFGASLDPTSGAVRVQGTF
jgi:hypothetical protein